MFNWSDWLGSSSPSMPVVQWSLLLALAAAVGHILQRNIGLPKVLGYSIIGALAGFLGFTNAPWPLDGVGLFLVELGLSIVLFNTESECERPTHPSQNNRPTASPWLRA